MTDHHQRVGFQSDQDLYEDLFGRGAGDGDVYDYPCYHDDFKILPLSGFEDKYMVTANGRIFSKTRTERAFAEHSRLRKGRWLKQSNLKASNGNYKAVELTNRKRYSIHRLVALTFIPNPENKPVVNHLDSDPSHNCVHNLEWATISENVQYSFDSGYAPHGADKPGAKLDWDKVAEIRLRLAGGESLKSLAIGYGVSKRLILFIKQNRAWKLPQEEANELAPSIQVDDKMEKCNVPF